MSKKARELNKNIKNYKEKRYSKTSIKINLKDKIKKKMRQKNTKLTKRQ